MNKIMITNMTISETVKKLKSVPLDTWYSVINRSGEDMTQIIKDLIDSKEQFELSNDYKYYKRLDDSWLFI